MMQEPGRRPPSTHRRSPRAGRNRPVLVTSTENEASEQVVENATPTLEESLAEAQAQNPPVTSAKRRLPGFFSTVGKSAQTQVSQVADIAQARLARAIRGKAAPTNTASTDVINHAPTKEVKKEPARTTRAAPPPRPASAFKTRYLIGMGLYLLGANFIGSYETSFLQSNHIDSVLTQFNLFGGLVVIRTSTLIFLATLVILLILLARFDLIPRSFGAMTGQSSSQANKRGGSSSNTNQNTSGGVKNTPPTMKQGVKGANDDLYQEYRANQRREKKK